MQTNLSHFKRDNTTQVYLPKYGLSLFLSHYSTCTIPTGQTPFCTCIIFAVIPSTDCSTLRLRGKMLQVFLNQSLTLQVSEDSSPPHQLKLISLYPLRPTITSHHRTTRICLIPGICAAFPILLLLLAALIVLQHNRLQQYVAKCASERQCMGRVVSKIREMRQIQDKLAQKYI